MFVSEANILGRMRWEYELRRVRFTLSSKKRSRYVRALTEHNEGLQQLLGSSDRLAQSRLWRKTPLLSAFRKIRENACALYDAAAAGWRCNSLSSHRINLILEKRGDVDERKQKPLFIDPVEQSNISSFKVFFEAQPDHKPPVSWVHHGLTVRVAELDNSNSTPKQAMAPSPSQDLLRAKENFTMGRYHSPLAKRQRPQVSFKYSPSIRSPSVSRLPAREELHSEILDLCLALDRPTGAGRCLGYLSGQSRRKLGLYPLAPPSISREGGETISLENCLRKSSEGSNDIKLSRAERFSIAALLASSILQLHTTPWLVEKWSKKDIVFFKRSKADPRPVVSQPFIRRDLTQSTTSPSTTDHSQALQSLGILLLELCFNAALEDEPLRANYLGPDGKPNDMTDFATAMRWWKEDALGEAGPEFYQAVRRCLLCAFGPPTTDLANDELRAAFYEGVVLPIEKIAQCFQ